MTSKSKVDIKAFFETGDKPTESQFIDLIDSYVDKSGLLGVLETNVSAGSAGFVYASAGDADIISDAAALTKLGVTVYTTALTSAVACDNINALYATTAQANAGTATGVLMNPVLVKNAIGALENSNNAMVLLSTVTASNSASIDFTSLITSAYSTYIFELDDLLPAADGDFLYMRTSTNNGSSFDSAASDYRWTVNTQPLDGTGTVVVTSDAADKQIKISGAVGNSAGEGLSGRVTLRSPLDTTRGKSVSFETTRQDGSTTYFHGWGAGTRNATTDVDAVQFLMSTGNITSGTIRMYGVLA